MLRALLVTALVAISAPGIWQYFDPAKVRNGKADVVTAYLCTLLLIIGLSAAISN